MTCHRFGFHAAMSVHARLPLMKRKSGDESPHSK
jgi:hypothetical protein